MNESGLTIARLSKSEYGAFGHPLALTKPDGRTWCPVCNFVSYDPSSLDEVECKKALPTSETDPNFSGYDEPPTPKLGDTWMNPQLGLLVRVRDEENGAYWWSPKNLDHAGYYTETQIDKYNASVVQVSLTRNHLNIKLEGEAGAIWKEYYTELVERAFLMELEKEELLVVTEPVIRVVKESRFMIITISARARALPDNTLENNHDLAQQPA